MPQPKVRDARETAETVARRSYGKLVAFLAARTGDVLEAEDALSEAFARALSAWPARGIPDSPEAWLLTVARRRLADVARHRRGDQAASTHLQLMAEEMEAAAAAGEFPDHRLALMFACAHPAVAENMRAPLMLQTVLGFDAASIASCFLTSPSTMGQRLVRAKHKIKQAGVPFQVPDRGELAERLAAVLDAVYATFAEGWSDPTGTETRRRNLAEEGIWLGRLIAALLPQQPEALGLLALMLHAEARRGARRDAVGAYVPLAHQDPARWEAPLIEEAEALLLRASSMGAVGRYQLEAVVQSAHAARRLTGQTDWAAIAQAYDVLWAMTQSPVVAINRAIAIAETHGAASGLAALNVVATDARLRDYQPYWAARATLLARTGHGDLSAAAYRRAIGLETDPAVRRYLQERRAELLSGRSA
jgi:RNA polymerase sigma-70 factor, ECF subfamily